MSDTPRIDAICKTRNCGYWGIPYEFACQLEREVGLLEHDIAIQNKQLSDCWVKIKSLESEVRNLRAMRDVIYGVKNES